ncbi:MAG: hypothetical protein RQ760_13865 [Sedimentisphaerales bacterium]|nr:hypothetical protein [Sedimentisphaerales bacterium]
MLTLSARRWFVFSISHRYSPQGNGVFVLKRERHVSHETVGRNLGIREAGLLLAGYHKILKHNAVEHMVVAQSVKVTA